MSYKWFRTENRRNAYRHPVWLNASLGGLPAHVSDIHETGACFVVEGWVDAGSTQDFVVNVPRLEGGTITLYGRFSHRSSRWENNQVVVGGVVEWSTPTDRLAIREFLGRLAQGQ